VSIAGIVITILAIVILVAVLVTAASRAAASSVTQPSSPSMQRPLHDHTVDAKAKAGAFQRR